MSSEKFKYFLDNFFKGDKTIWMIYFFLCMISIVEIYSASSNLTYKSGHHWAPLISQFVFLVIGFIIILVMHRVPCKCFKLLPYPLIIISVLLLIITRLIGGDVNNSQRWLQMGGISFQPSEMAKTALILMLALILSRSQVEVKIRNKSGVKIVSRAIKNGTSAPFKKCVIYIILVCGLICTENFSTAAILFTVAVSMMFVGNIPTKLMIKGIGAIGVLGIIAATMLIITPDSTLSNITKRAPTWKARIMNKFGGEENEEMSSKEVMKQENSALIAVANSNIIGRGPGNSEERDFLYRAESDFIYAIIIEETGIFGGLTVLALYIILLVRAGRIAQKCDKFFPAILIMGLSTMLVLQALINMGVAVGLLPVTGQTLPLISKGGSSIIITSFNIGMILSISRYAEKVNNIKDNLFIEEEDNENTNSLVNETNEYFSSTGMD